MNESDIVMAIEAAMPGALVFLQDSTGQRNHFDAVVVSSLFQGKSRVAQHQLVMAALDNYLKSGALHALALKTYTPEMWKELE